MLRLRSIFVGRLGHFCSVGQRTCRRTTLTAGDKWARLSGISCTTGPVCGAVGYDTNSGSVVGTRRPRRWRPGIHGADGAVEVEQEMTGAADDLAQIWGARQQKGKDDQA